MFDVECGLSIVSFAFVGGDVNIEYGYFYLKLGGRKMVLSGVLKDRIRNQW